MKAIKNFEALFLVAAATATFATYAVAEVPVRAATVPAAVSAAAKAAPAASAMQVVVIKGHRLTAAEKAAL